MSGDRNVSDWNAMAGPERKRTEGTGWNGVDLTGSEEIEMERQERLASEANLTERI